MIGEIFDRVLTYGTPAFLLIKELLGKVAGHPELQKEALKKFVEIAKSGRTRTDELVFIASLVTLSGPDATLKNKQLFLQKHYALLHPDLTGKNPVEIAELREKEKMAKGLIFLIAADPTASDVTCNRKDSFRLANEVWYGIFMGIKDLPDEDSKLQMLERKILYFGKNHQEHMTLAESVGWFKKIVLVPFGVESVEDLLQKAKQQLSENSADLESSTLSLREKSRSYRQKYEGRK